MTRITVVAGDITTQQVDAIVNAANEHLQHGGGVAAAIARAGGPVIQQESDAWVATNGPLSPGVAAATSAGNMSARFVIHVAGPIHRHDQDNAGLLAMAVGAALDAAALAGCRTVAMPAISAGIYGYPVAEATQVIGHAVRAWCTQHAEALDEVRLVGRETDVATAFQDALADPPASR